MYQLCADEGNGRHVKETIADVLSVSPSSERMVGWQMSRGSCIMTEPTLGSCIF